MDAVPCPVVGITGSAGKTTTTTLMGRIAQKAVEAGLYRKAFVGGNIGFPLIRELDDMTADDLAVVEFSSFQLDLMTTSPHVAAVLNITPNHLDRHGSMAAYSQAKQNIFSHQAKEDFLVLGFEDENAWALAGKCGWQSLCLWAARFQKGSQAVLCVTLRSGCAVTWLSKSSCRSRRLRCEADITC